MHAICKPTARLLPHHPSEKVEETLSLLAGLALISHSHTGMYCVGRQGGAGGFRLNWRKHTPRYHEAGLPCSPDVVYISEPWLGSWES